MKCLVRVCKLGAPDQLTVGGIERGELRESVAKVQGPAEERRRAVYSIGTLTTINLNDAGVVAPYYASVALAKGVHSSIPRPDVHDPIGYDWCPSHPAARCETPRRL